MTAAAGGGGEGGGGGGRGGSSGGRGSMLCCGGDKDSGRDLKSAQNTPSRQPINLGQQQQFPLGQSVPPPQQSGGTMMMDKSGMMGPPPLTQVGRMQQQQQMNNFDMRGGEDFKKVSIEEFNRFEVQMFFIQFKSFTAPRHL